jgi:hypothetical protein
MQAFGKKVRINIWHIALIGSLFVGAAGASELIEVGYRGPSYPPGTGDNSRPTGEKPESKLWWNDGFWWGILWSIPGNAYHIHQLDPVTQDWVDTATAVDDRSASRSDVKWDGQRLYVVSHMFSETGVAAPSGERGELYRFSYDAATRTYHLDFGFPVEVTGGKSEALVMEKDSRSRLWVTYVENGRVMVNHSIIGDDRTWRQPFVLPVPGADQVGEDDISSIIAFNGRVGVMWSDQQFPTGTLPDPTGVVGARMLFGVHRDDQHPSLWLADAVYTPSGDDHINLKALKSDRDGNIFAAIKTAKDAKIIMLLVCKSWLAGCHLKSNWTHFEVYKSKEVDPSRPIVLIDQANRQLYVFVMAEDSNDHRVIYYKKTPIDNIKFPTGRGVPFIRSATDLDINDPTSTKQNLNGTTDLVVLASDEVTNHYFHNYLRLP